MIDKFNSRTGPDRYRLPDMTGIRSLSEKFPGYNAETIMVCAECNAHEWLLIINNECAEAYLKKHYGEKPVDSE